MNKVRNGLLNSICQYNTIQGKLSPLSNLKGWEQGGTIST
jgi:hypothetical protein